MRAAHRCKASGVELHEVQETRRVELVEDDDAGPLPPAGRTEQRDGGEEIAFLAELPQVGAVVHVGAAPLAERLLDVVALLDEYLGLSDFAAVGLIAPRER